MSTATESLLKVLIAQNVELARIQQAQANNIVVMTSSLETIISKGITEEQAASIRKDFSKNLAHISTCVAEIEELHKVSDGHGTVPMLG